jgi:hypothetical protein
MRCEHDVEYVKSLIIRKVTCKLWKINGCFPWTPSLVTYQTVGLVFVHLHPAIFLSLSRLYFYNKHFLVRPAFTVEKMKEHSSQTCARFFFLRFWIVISCCVVVVCRRFRVICYLHYRSTQIMDAADYSEALVCTLLLEHTTSHSIGHERVPYLTSCRIYFTSCSKACHETGKMNVILPYKIKREAVERAEIAGRDLCCCDRTVVLITTKCWVHTTGCYLCSQ